MPSPWSICRICTSSWTVCTTSPWLWNRHVIRRRRFLWITEEVDDGNLGRWTIHVCILIIKIMLKQLYTNLHYAYRYFSVGVANAYQIVTRLDRLMIATKELVGEQFHIQGLPVYMPKRGTAWFCIFWAFISLFSGLYFLKSEPHSLDFTPFLSCYRS